MSDGMYQSDEEMNAASTKVLLEVSIILAEMGIQDVNWAEKHLEG
ncbi:hypothetical protein [Paenibacillus sp. YIM B09110]